MSDKDIELSKNLIEISKLTEMYKQSWEALNCDPKNEKWFILGYVSGMIGGMHNKVDSEILEDYSDTLKKDMQRRDNH